MRDTASYARSRACSSVDPSAVIARIRSEERREGKSVDLDGGSIIKKKTFAFCVMTDAIRHLNNAACLGSLKATSRNPSMPKDPEKNFLRAWRELRRLTQAQLAESIDTTGAVISLLESGDRRMSDKWARRLGPALGIPP